MATTIDGTENVYDSRDIIARLEELREANADEDTTLSEEEIEELRMLQALDDYCDGYGDWRHGETLIARSYFVDYIRDLIDYDMPERMNSGDWPYRHMAMDYEAAANEAEQDYMSVYICGNEYLMRC